MMNPLIPFNSILSQFAHQSGIASFDAKSMFQASNARSTVALQQNNTRGFIAKDFAGELFFAR